jgi:hypothetical protein
MKKKKREATIFPKGERQQYKAKNEKKKLHHHIELKGKIINKKTFIKG